ncbi:hypothetical protein HHK36_000273 [Tetracentron sinense]|uniref:DUF4005 domain-containing protein n=1 Tax=Tetracentron sinense TaxID=13715 RepID=A0A835A1C2_TETSI|nr:hypothetical protein HHK36_000273 [Tetracentron sinense]
MGKTARWFRGLLGGKKSAKPPAGVSSSEERPVKEKKRWGFARSFKEKEHTVLKQMNLDEKRGSYREASSCSYNDGVDSDKHAIAVAAATAAVAEAAVAAAQAAAAVVRLTSSGRSATAYVSGGREKWAAVIIQASFRGYLARRALGALKGLVKLQALVRGHIVRKQTADTMRRMQALVRVQGPSTPEKYEHVIRTKSTKREWSSRTSTLCDRRRGTSIGAVPTDDEKSDKILEVDTGTPNFNSKRRNNAFNLWQPHFALDQNAQSLTTLDSPSKDSTTAQKSGSTTSSGEVQSLMPLKFPHQIDETVDNSPQFFSASSRPDSAKRGPFTPTTSDCSRSGFSDYPNYMAYTESSRAKFRSLSAPKQRLEFEKSSSMKRYFVHGCGDARASAPKVSVLHANFTSKAYPGSGRLDRLGMPVRGDTVGFNGVYRNRY